MKTEHVGGQAKSRKLAKRRKLNKLAKESRRRNRVKDW